ncbi:MAG: metallophosphoesterase family protein [Anaerolineales bacterium]|jgi:putative phosphoesterase
MEILEKRIALLGDVHANLPALEAVLSHAKSLGVSMYWNIGDFVGYNAFPDQVVKRMQEKKFCNIIGNYDIKVLKFPQKEKKWRKNKQAQKWMAFQWAYQNLSPESRAYLASLPEERRLVVGDQEFLLVHASPLSNEEVLDKSTPDERLWELKNIAEHNYEAEFAAIVCGHSHEAFTRRIGNTLFINTGSVGRPGDGNPRAAYAILQITGTRLQVSHYRLNYEIGEAVKAIRKNGLPKAFGEMLIHGRDLEWVLEH